jgi:hypothetical protein
MRLHFGTRVIRHPHARKGSFGQSVVRAHNREL